MSKYRTYLKEIKAICLAKGFDCMTYGLSNGFELPIVAIVPEKYSKTLLIVAGLHGNEPAPVHAVKEFLSAYESGETRLFVIPCMNPWGFENNVRKNANGADLNRIRNSKPLEEEQRILFQYLFGIQFDGALSMHEDSSTRKTYFYGYGRTNDVAYRSIQAEAGKYAELNTKDRIDGNPAERGIIYDKLDSSLESFLHSQNIGMVLCSETGSRNELCDRVKCNIGIFSAYVSV